MDGEKAFVALDLTKSLDDNGVPKPARKRTRFMSSSEEVLKDARGAGLRGGRFFTAAPGGPALDKNVSSENPPG